MQEDIITYKTIIVLVAFLLFFVFEHIKPAAPRPHHNERRHLKNLLFWPLNIITSVLVVIPVSYFSAEHVLWHRPEFLSGMRGLTINIILLDLFMYIWHRSLHEIPFLWRFHEVHHLDEHLDTTTALRFHFGEVFISAFVRAVAIIFLAVPFSSVVIFETLVLVCAFFHHSNMSLPVWFEKSLSKLVITPSLHWVHHHALRKDTDSNYGTIFSFWDCLLNTRSPTARYASMPIGVETMKDKTFSALLIAPFSYRRQKGK